MTSQKSSSFNLKDEHKLKAHLIEAVTQKSQGIPSSASAYQEQILDWVHQAYDRSGLELDEPRREKIFRDVLAELVGYGPIQPLLDDPTISEIMVSGPNQIYVERHGKLLDTNLTFDDDDHVMRIIDRILHPLGRQVNRDAPSADARLPDGSRVNIVIPPVAVDGPCITIRKFLDDKYSVEQLVDLGTLTPYMSEFLRACVVSRLNILITGNTSSGKTTLLNLLIGHIPNEERIITIEDAAELQLEQKYVVRLETKMPNVDGEGAVTARDLVHNALRMRPDRIVIGEVRGSEALDMLQAMNTGHEGSLTTLHANSPRDAISRLETMSMMAGLELPLKAIRKQIISAVDLIVHMKRLIDGKRKIVRISEVPRMEGDVPTLSDIYKFEKTGLGPDGEILGEMIATGLRPIFTPRLEVAGFKLGGEIFGAG
ncbi:MAG: CpaF family protein [Chloroflexota bacterium]|nr:CpaF family protein [Chloroflexota bacterium]